MKKTIWLTMMAAALLCVAAPAQEKKGAEKKKAAGGSMPMAKPAPEMKDLRDMIGTWSTEETYEVSPFMPSGGTGTGTNTVRQGPGGFTVLMEHRSKGAMGSFSGHGVLTWDPAVKAYKMVWADSMTPGVVIATGHKEGDTLVFNSEMTMNGKKIATKDVIADRTPASYTLTSYMNDGSGEKKTMSMKLTKQEPAPAKK